MPRLSFGNPLRQSPYERTGSRAGRRRREGAPAPAPPLLDQGGLRRHRGGERQRCALAAAPGRDRPRPRSEEHTSELQSHHDLVCRLLLEKKKKKETQKKQAEETAIQKKKE